LSARREYWLLAALTTVNLLNFIDRQVLFAIFPAVKADLGLRDAELGLAASAFIVVYMIVTPIAGYLGDRFDRPRLIATGVALWSAATLGSGAARGFSMLLASRALVGIGEACYSPLSSAIIGDSFPPARRGSSLAIFNVAVPVGSAFGYLLGGLIAGYFGWRAAFYVVGAPGLALAALIACFRDPERGAMDRSSDSRATMSALLADRVYVVTTAAQAALTFVLGALGAWLPTFLVRLHGLSVTAAGGSFGILTAVAGLIGTGLGGWLGDRAAKRDPRGHLRVSAAGLLLAAPVAAAAIVTRDPIIFWTATAIAEILVFLNVGPLNAVIVSAAAPSIRATAVAVNILAIHLLGDALSPWVVGELSDRFGVRRALAIMPPMLALSGILCLVAGRYVTQRHAKARADR
jgi:MFS transporter, Spinster family, sphingosine-1-phosphate transporter